MITDSRMPDAVSPATKSDVGFAKLSLKATPLSMLPVSLFASVMGLAALQQGWEAAVQHFGWSSLPADAIGALAVSVFLLLAVAYSLKFSWYRAAVDAEFAHPVTRNYFGMPLICLLLLPIFIAPLSRPVAVGAWLAGVVGMLAFVWAVVSRWFSQPQPRPTVTTAWLVMAVGVLDIPLAMPALSVPTTGGIGFSCVVVGLTLALLLLAVIVPRYMFDPPTLAGQTPALLIAAAPFAIGFSSYLTVTGQIDGFAEGLLDLAVVVLAALLVPVGRHLLRAPFHLSWWGISFPVAATAGACLRFASVVPGHAVAMLAGGMLVFATAVISALLLRTVVGLTEGRFKVLVT